MDVGALRFLITSPAATSPSAAFAKLRLNSSSDSTPSRFKLVNPVRSGAECKVCRNSKTAPSYCLGQANAARSLGQMPLARGYR